MFAFLLATAVHWNCSTPLLPDYNAKANAPDVGEAVSYLYAGDKNFHSDYSVDALFTANFVKPGEQKFVEIRTETSVVGRNGGASVTDIRLKRDSDARARPYASDCVMHRYGISWRPIGPGVFKASGAFYPNEATFFTGADPNTRCRT
jgi:hypothetical protein